MSTSYEYRFRIDAFTPATMPMARLAEYMADLAALFGEPERVHFARLEEGSAVLVQTIDGTAMPKVLARVRTVPGDDAPTDALKAFQNLDRRLAQDNAIATLTAPDGAEILRFPGRERPAPLTYRGFRQQGSLDGVLVSIGGRDESAHATLQEADQFWRCETTRARARELGGHLYQKPLRVFGEGRWQRDADGDWILRRFVVSHFEVLDDAPWPETVARLRKIEGAAWKELDDPLGELARLRHEGDEPH
jgi:hypothetical protein